MCVRPGLLRPLVGLVLLLLGACATSPPVQEMSDARQAIAAATEANAEEHAPRQLADARRLIAEAERQIREESYGQARANALRAKNRAVQALETAERAAAEASAD